MTWQGLGLGLDLGLSHGLGGIGAVEAGHRRELRAVSVRARAPSAVSVRAPGPSAGVRVS